MRWRRRSAKRWTRSPERALADRSFVTVEHFGKVMKAAVRRNSALEVKETRNV